MPDSVLLLAASVLIGSAAPAAPLAVAALTTTLVVLLWRRTSRVVQLAGAVLVVVAAGRAELAARAYESRRLAAWHEIETPARCAGPATVIGSPIVRDGTVVYTADSAALDCEGRLLQHVRVRLYGGPRTLRRGDRLTIVAQLAPTRLFRNAELPDPTFRAARWGVLLSGSALAVELDARGWGPRAWIDAARAHARARIEATFSPAATPMARALVLGEDDLAEQEAQAFRESGLAHMLAVSGTHLVFAVLGIVAGLRFVLVRIPPVADVFDVGRLAAGIGVALAVLYADFAGGSGSAWRAAWMLAVGLGARALGRRPDGPRALALSLGVGWLFDPLIAFDVSFLLSAAATCGLLWLGRPWAQRVSSWQSRPVRYVVQSLIATTASMLPCAPFLALLTPSITVAGLVANVVAAPFGEAIALPLCLAHVLLGPIPVVERGAAMVASGALLVVRQVALASAATSWLSVPIPLPGAWHWVLLGVMVVGASVARLRLAWLIAGVSTLGALEVAVRWAAQPRHLLRVTVSDVGQGDCTWVDLPDGRLMMIDGGGFVGSPVDPGHRVGMRLLRARRRQRIDIAVLSHPHPDHLLGFATVLQNVEVGELWDTGQGEAEGAGPQYAAMLADLRARGVPIRRPSDLCGRSHRAGQATIQVLGPCPGFEPGVNANDNSLVVRIEHGSHAVLLAGDAEHEQEQRLVGRHAQGLRADLLKVGHHGSRTSSSPAWLGAVRPRWATISSGVRNRHGHPHRAALDRLAAAGSIRLRLDVVGSVTWQTDGSEMTVRAFEPDLLPPPLDRGSWAQYPGLRANSH